MTNFEHYCTQKKGMHTVCTPECEACGLRVDGTRRKVNSLGQPAPNRTDFTSWERGTLERFARLVADENLVLHNDLKVALASWRAAVRGAP